MTEPAPLTSSADVDIDGAKLREMRQDQGYSQAALAGLCGITFQYVSQLETGARLRVSPAIWVRLCEALKIDPANRRVLRKQQSRVA